MKYEDIEVGYQGKFTREVSEEVNRKFGELVDDFNPVHFDEERMEKSIFGRRATNAFLTESTIGCAIVDMFVDDENCPIVLKKEIKLVAPVFIGDTVVATVTVKEKNEEKERLVLDCKVEKLDGTQVVQAEFLAKILSV